MRFGINTLLWGAGTDQALFDRFPAIRADGYDGVELTLIWPQVAPVAAIRRNLEANQLTCTFCAVLPPAFSMVSEDAGTRQRTLAHLSACVRAAAEAGAKILAGPLYASPAYRPGRRRTEDEWKWAVESYQALGGVLEACGVTVALEAANRFETYFINIVADLVKLVDEIGHPNVGVVFDTFHANIEEKNIAEALRSVGGRLKHFHAGENDRGTPGGGHMDWPPVFQALAELRYDGWMTIEGFGSATGPLAAAVSVWRDLAPSTESVASDGVRFLKLLAAQGHHGIDASRPA